MYKNNILCKLSMAFVIITITIVACFIGCQKENDIIPDTVPVGLKKYFESYDYADLKNNFEFRISDFSLNNIIEENPTPEIAIYYVPIQKDNRFGVLAVFSKNNGEVYKSLFEDRSELKNQTNGLFPIYTAKNFFVAEFKFERLSIDDTTVKMQINRVGNLTIGAPCLKGGNEFPNPNDGWWQCTTDCYNWAMDSCHSDIGCFIICEMLNLVVGSCMISVAAACAIFCI